MQLIPLFQRSGDRNSPKTCRDSLAPRNPIIHTVPQTSNHVGVCSVLAFVFVCVSALMPFKPDCIPPFQKYIKINVFTYTAVSVFIKGNGLYRL